jgi:hypothetical protein
MAVPRTGWRIRCHIPPCLRRHVLIGMLLPPAMRHTLSLLVVASSAIGQTITLAEGTPTSLTIVAIPEATPDVPGTTVLQGVELLPIEVTGRTLAQELDATRSRRVTRNGTTRVELPGGGRLFRYRRASGQFWGFLHIAAHGAPTIVVERASTGPQLLDPFADRIAVAADGRHAAFALAAGGLVVARLDGGTFASTGAPWRQVVANGVDVVPTSVMIGSSHVWLQAGAGTVQLFRCAIADGEMPVDVTPPSQPLAELKDQMVITPDGAHLVFLYGPDDQQRLWHCSDAGASSVLPPPPGKYEEPGYLPEDPGEPAMLLNDTGTRLFYVESAVRDELSLLDLSGSMPALAMTADSVFQPYIGVHILPKFRGDRLLIAIGDPGQMDWFRAELAPGGGSVANLTGTGSLLQPFPSGTIAPVQAVDSNGHVLVVEGPPNAQVLRRIDAIAGTQAVVQQGLVGAPEVGGTFGPSPDLLVRTTAGESVWFAATGSLFASVPPGITLTPPARGRMFSATWVALASQWGCAAFWLPDGTLATGPLEFDLRQLCLTARNGVVVIGNPLRYLAPGVYTVMNRPPVPLRLCLSGAGA